MSLGPLFSIVRFGCIRLKYRQRVFLCVAVLLAPRVEAAEMVGKLSFGYDDNVSLSPVPIESGFLENELEFSHGFFPDLSWAVITGFAGIAYQYYFSAEDNWHIQEHSSIKDESYQGTVTQCGVVYSF